MRTLRHISVRRGQHYHRSETLLALINQLLLHPEKKTGKNQENYDMKKHPGPANQIYPFCANHARIQRMWGGGGVWIQTPLKIT